MDFFPFDPKPKNVFFCLEYLTELRSPKKFNIKKLITT